MRRGLTTAEAHGRLELSHSSRSIAFARSLHRSVFQNPDSPYRKLFDWAGVSFSDANHLIASVGVEKTLERLHDAGIFVTLEEFKGLRPLQRPGLELDTHAHDFDSPCSVQRYEAYTGGSGGKARKVQVGLDLLEHESAYHSGFRAVANGDDSAERPFALWLPAPPGAVGIKNALIWAKLGNRVDRWFSQSRPEDVPKRHGAFATATMFTANALGAEIPLPIYTPAGDAIRVASWLATQCSIARPAALATTPSAAVRVCASAKDAGVSIAGTFFILVGEPYTKDKAALIAHAGCRAASHYAMVEAGMIGLACMSPNTPDDVHLVSDKIATIQRDRTIGGNGATVRALFHTTLLPSAPKLMLNVESGDYGIREERECGCGVVPAAFRDHLHTIRSYEKLTSEGMHFLGADLILLLENELPARFGGTPTDYQFVEREENGLTRVSLVVRSSIGVIDGDEILRTVLTFLRGRGTGPRLMAEVWSNGHTLKIVRGDPHVTKAGKILALQVLSS